MSMRRSVRAHERGMSMIEVLIALTILAFALLGLMPLFASAVKTTASANQLSNANTLAREKLEELSGYPRGDQRLTVAAGANAAVPTGVTTTGTGSVVAVNVFCNNDLPTWYSPSTGAVSFASTSPGAGYYAYPYVRTYIVELYGADMATRITAPATYVAARLTVTVRPTQGPFPGLRQTTQTYFLRSPNV
jgi:prepilin-type N-terminal cleavage/methylation domain-containing protein